MPPWLNDLFAKTDFFMPHGHCFLWIPGLLWLHVVSDALIGIAYLGISLILYLLVRKIRLPFSPVFVAFGLFIALCGLTHFLAVWTIWNPDYWLDGLVKAATAAASVATALGVLLVRPQVEEMVHAARLSEERRSRLETTNAELEALYKKVKDLDQMKTQFFANVSHELRTPLSLMMGPAERMMDDPDLSDAQRRQLASIARNGKSLLKHVNDLLDVARLEEGKMQVQYNRLDLAAQFREIASQFEVTAEHRNIRYRIALPESLSAEADTSMLERVLINLLSNAFKFTPEGGEIHLAMDSDDDTVTLSVADTGPGIAADEQEAVFQRFRQTDGSDTRTHGGTGLGLAIVRDFVELHGGTIELQSEVGAGACFTVNLPLRAPESAVVTSPAEASASTARATLEGALEELTPPQSDGWQAASATPDTDRPTVLVVEDTPDMRHFVADVLADDFQVVTADDGEEGLEKALALQPDLIVSDLMMPRMSGEQLVVELRQRTAFDTVPVLLLTAKADDQLRVDLLQKGVQDYLNKPFLPRELQARASNLITVKRTGDALRNELMSASVDLESMANELALRHRELQTAMSATELARERAEQASQVKTHFLTMISHEMRTPLSTIHMNAQLLGRQHKPDLSPAAQSQLERMVRASQQLSSLIEGLLEYTRVESGRISAQVESVDTVELAREAVEIGRLQIGSPDVSLTLAPPPAKLTPFETDPRLLRVVLNNLIANALKFTREGRVTLRLDQSPEWRTFEVEDTGIGISEEDIPRIFQPFEQLEPLRRKSIPGVGLGLALVKEIVEALDGDIQVTSEADVGSRFCVRLPNRRLRLEKAILPDH